jgi:predicted DNA-binding protein
MAKNKNRSIAFSDENRELLKKIADKLKRSINWVVNDLVEKHGPTLL